MPLFSLLYDFTTVTAIPCLLSQSCQGALPESVTEVDYRDEPQHDLFLGTTVWNGLNTHR
jgi:hypothetical protein